MRQMMMGDEGGKSGETEQQRGVQKYAHITFVLDCYTTPDLTLTDPGNVPQQRNGSIS